MNDWFSYLIIGGVFLGGMIPLVAGIVHYIRENKKLDNNRKGNKDKKHKAAYEYLLENLFIV